MGMRNPIIKVKQKYIFPLKYDIHFELSMNLNFRNKLSLYQSICTVFLTINHLHPIPIGLKIYQTLKNARQSRKLKFKFWHTKQYFRLSNII